MANIQHKNQNIEDEAERREIMENEFQTENRLHQRKLKLAGVVPKSDKYLGHEDVEGN